MSVRYHGITQSMHTNTQCVTVTLGLRVIAMCMSTRFISQICMCCAWCSITWLFTPHQSQIRWWSMKQICNQSHHMITIGMFVSSLIHLCCQWYWSSHCHFSSWSLLLLLLLLVLVLVLVRSWLSLFYPSFLTPEWYQHLILHMHIFTKQCIETTYNKRVWYRDGWIESSMM